MSLGAGVILKAHPDLEAKAHLINTSVSTISLEHNYLPPLLRESSQISQPFSLTSSGGIEPPLNTLELTGIDTATNLNSKPRKSGNISG